MREDEAGSNATRNKVRVGEEKRPTLVKQLIFSIDLRYRFRFAAALLTKSVFRRPPMPAQNPSSVDMIRLQPSKLATCHSALLDDCSQDRVHPVQARHILQGVLS